MTKLDQRKISEALSRGVKNIYPSKLALEEVLKSGKKLRVYNGIDPTGPTLHLGHLVQLLKLKQFQELGHEIIVLIGDFTAQIGDPTDKMAARKPLSRKQVLNNAKDYKKQIGQILDLKKTQFKFNSQWLAQMSLKDAIKLASEFTVQRLLERDMFEKRMKIGKSIHLHEFLYPVMQCYDSIVLDVDLEVGGSDQTFNMLAGRILMRKIKNKEKFVLATKLLEDPTGKKMGKTEGNIVSLKDEPKEIYGKIMSWPDELIVPGFELLTTVSLPQVLQVKKDLQAGKNPKILKMLLAYKIVEMCHKTIAAISAEEYFKQVFQQKLNPKEMPKFSIKQRNIIDVLIVTKLASSKSEARRLIKQGGIKVDGQVVKDENLIIEPRPGGALIQKGKRFFVKIIS